MRFDPRRVEKTELSIFDALDVGGCRWIWMYVDVHGLEEDWRHGKVRGFSADLFKKRPKFCKNVEIAPKYRKSDF